MPKGVVCQYKYVCTTLCIYNFCFTFIFVLFCLLRVVKYNTHTHKMRVIYTQKWFLHIFAVLPKKKKYFGSMNVFKILKVVHYELCI